MVYNPWSINNKVNKVMQYLCDNNIDVAGICETWLTDTNSPTTAWIRNYGFSIIHNFREGRRAGGTAIIYKSTLSFSPISFSGTFKTLEYTAASSKLASSTKILYLIIYRTGPLTSSFCSEVDTLLSQASSKCDLIIIEKGLASQVLNVFKSYGFKKHINVATHINGGSLDQIFTFSMSKGTTFSCSVDSDNIIGSDHFPVICDMNVPHSKKFFKSIAYRDLLNMDTESFKSKLVTIADELLKTNFPNFDEANTYLSDNTRLLLDEFAPLITKKISVVPSFPAFDNEYRELRKARRKAERKWRRTKLVEDRVNYKNLCSECSILAHTKKKEYFCEMIHKSNGNSKTLYKMVDRELDRKQTKKLPDYTDDLMVLTDDCNEFFIDKIDNIRKEMPHHDVHLASSASEQGVFMRDFEPTNFTEIREILDETGIKCSPADSLPTSVFKENLDTLIPVIVKLVNLSLATGNFEGLKLAEYCASSKR